MTYPAHDLHMLAFAASMDGQRGVAVQAARGFARLTSDSMLLSLVLVRFGQFDEVATLGERPANDISAGVWDFAQRIRRAAARRSKRRRGGARTAGADGAQLEGGLQDSSRPDAAWNRGRHPGGRDPSRRHQRRGDD